MPSMTPPLLSASSAMTGAHHSATPIAMACRLAPDFQRFTELPLLLHPISASVNDSQNYSQYISTEKRNRLSILRLLSRLERNLLVGINALKRLVSSLMLCISLWGCGSQIDQAERHGRSPSAPNAERTPSQCF
jgi:hypothetical protein